MSIMAAAERIGVHPDTVRVWVDEHEGPGREPVAARERDSDGRPIPGRHRRPYVDAVEEWERRRAGERVRPVPPAP
jgi:transposase-like protein